MKKKRTPTGAATFLLRTNTAVPSALQLLANPQAGAPFTLQDLATRALRCRDNATWGANMSVRRNMEDAEETAPHACGPYLLQTEPLAQLGIFRSQLLRQSFAEPLVFLLELHKICQFVADRDRLGALGAL